MPAEQYKLKPEAFTRIKRNILIAIGPLLLAIAVPRFYAKLYNGESTDWTEVGVIGGVVIVLVAINIFRLLRKKKKFYDDFVLIIDKGSISGKDITGKDIDMSWIEVTKIVKQTNGGLLICGGPATTIEIPAEIENKARLEMALNEISPLLANPVTFFTKYFKVLVLTVTATLLVFIYSGNRIIIGITGPLLIIIFARLFFMMNGWKADTGKIQIKWFFLIPMVGIAVKMYYIFQP